MYNNRKTKKVKKEHGIMYFHNQRHDHNYNNWS